MAMPRLRSGAVLVAAMLCTLASAAASSGARPIKAADMAQAKRIEVDYALHCQGCHLPDGSGSAGKVPDLRQSLAHFLRVPGGREFLVQVPGVATSRLDDAGTARLLNWMVETMGGGLPCTVQPFTAEEVGNLRKAWLRKAGPVRARLMEQVAKLPAAPRNTCRS